MIHQATWFFHDTKCWKSFVNGICQSFSTDKVILLADLIHKSFQESFVESPNTLNALHQIMDFAAKNITSERIGALPPQFKNWRFGEWAIECNSQSHRFSNRKQTLVFWVSTGTCHLFRRCSTTFFTSRRTNQTQVIGNYPLFYDSIWGISHSF